MVVEVVGARCRQSFRTMQTPANWLEGATDPDKREPRTPGTRKTTVNEPRLARDSSFPYGEIKVRSSVLRSRSRFVLPSIHPTARSNGNLGKAFGGAAELSRAGHCRANGRTTPQVARCPWGHRTSKAGVKHKEGTGFRRSGRGEGGRELPPPLPAWRASSRP
jgi:hypothetical protein